MKFRHILPWIPFVGIFYVLFFAHFVWTRANSKTLEHLNYLDYIWGSRWSYYASMSPHLALFVWLIF